MANIINISDVDKYGEEFNEAIKKALVASAYKVRDKAREHLLTQYPKTHPFVEGIYVSKERNNKIAISSLGSSSDEDYKARFFVGGTKKREQWGGYRKTRDGIKWVFYKKAANKGKINPTNSLQYAMKAQENTIHQFFQHLKLDDKK